MGQGSSQLLSHTWIMNMAKKPWYITEKRNEKKGGGRKIEREREVEEIQQ